MTESRRGDMSHRLAAGTEIEPVGPLLELLAYWNIIRGTQLLPARADFDPVAVAPLLSRIFLIEWIAPSQRLRFRLVGTALVAAAGADHTGHWLDAVANDQDPLITMCRRSIDEARPIAHVAYRDQIRAGSDFLHRSADSSKMLDGSSQGKQTGKDWLFTRILLPLDRSDGGGGMILGLEDLNPDPALIARISS